jgi:hypothetical protein
MISDIISVIDASPSDENNILARQRSRGLPVPGNKDAGFRGGRTEVFTCSKA